ncbi:MAG: ABC transporter permease [Dehalococcoidia bacterium]|nr:MAG: ABC transporter permease [Dehalococcoidia bacterium]
MPATALAEQRRGTPNAFRRLIRQRGAPIALGVLLIVIACAVFAPAIAPANPATTHPLEALKSPSSAHFLGTDQLGRDILSRVIYGARISLLIGFLAVTLSVVIGVPLGLISGYFGGMVDHVIMRAMDTIIAFPQIILALAIVAAFGGGMLQVLFAISVGSVPPYCRVTRAQVLSVREEDYIRAAQSMGSTNLRILAQHVLPNVTSPLIVQASLGVAFAILAEAGLSFLGVGVDPKTATWGGMLSQALPIIRRAFHPSLFPGLAIFVTVLSVNVLGDALRDVLDPRLRGRS